MTADTKVELRENALVSLRIMVPEEEIKSEYNSVVTGYCKKVAIKGFRKGKVPPEVLIRKFGDSIKDETAGQVVEKSLKEALEKVEYKPLPYSIPKLVDEIKIELGAEFSYEVTYDTFPKVELGDYQELDVEEPVVEISDEDMDRELAIVQDQNAVVVDKPGSVVEKGDTVTIDYTEMDADGNEIEGKSREGFTFTVGSGYNVYKIDEDIEEMSKDEERVLTKEYPDDFETPDLAGKTLKLKVKVTGVKEKKLPEINDELAQDVSEKYNTLDDLKADISKKLQEAVENGLRMRNIKKLFDKIVENSKIPVPDSMIQQELNQRWTGFLGQFGSNEELVLQLLEKQGKSREDLYEEWRPDAEKAVKVRLAENKVSEEEKIEISEEEVDEQIRKEADGQKKEFEEIKSFYVENNLLDYIKTSLKAEKARTSVLESARIKKDKAVKLLDFMQGKD